MHREGVDRALWYIDGSCRLGRTAQVFCGIGCELGPAPVRAEIESPAVMLRLMARRRGVYRHSADGIGGGLVRMIAVMMCVVMSRLVVRWRMRMAAAASAGFSGTRGVLRGHLRLQLLRILPWGGTYGP
jgi:hypothetical protein